MAGNKDSNKRRKRREAIAPDPRRTRNGKPKRNKKSSKKGGFDPYSWIKPPR